MVGMAALGDRMPKQLSGGQQQRVALARAVAVRPAVLLLDEPLSNLDLKLREQMRDEIRRLQRSLGITALYVTHDQGEAMAMSDRIVVMNQGTIEQFASPREIYEHPASIFVARFIGQCTILTGRLDRVQGPHQIFLTPSGVSLKLALGAEPIARGSACAVIVRPELTEIFDQLNAVNDATTNVLTATVEDVVYVGERVNLSLNSARGTLSWQPGVSRRDSHWQNRANRFRSCCPRTN